MAVCLAEKLYMFFTRSDRENNRNGTVWPVLDQHKSLILDTDEVRRVLHSANVRKAAGPDNIPGRVLQECTDQLSEVFTSIFNLSLTCAVVPKCLETTTIVPIPKQQKVNCLKDYRPVALMPLISKFWHTLKVSFQPL